MSMGYHQSIIVSSALDYATREHARKSAGSRWPFLRSPRRSEAYSERLLLALPELTDYLFDKDEESEAAQQQSFQVESELANWSQEFPSAIFAYIEADCFGGTCAYSGFACRADTIIERVKPSDHAHISLLRHVDIVTDSVFEPFTRVYFEGRCSGLRT
jgi:hypothetical protein